MQTIFRRSLIAQLVAIAALGTNAEAAVKTEAYPGQIQLKVDLSESARKIFQIKETIPVSTQALHNGKLSLTFPKWIPGEHGPTGPIDGVTGLKFFANGQRVAWRRDLQDMYLLHLDVPAGSKEIQAEFQFLSPVAGGDFGAGVSATPRFVMMEWNQVVFYPADYASDKIKVAASLTIPAKWQMATALEQEGQQDDGRFQFKPVSLTELVDSPIMAGAHFKRIPLSAEGQRPVFLNLAADRADNLRLSDAQIQQHQALVKQARTMFGVEHFQRYEFLLLLSNHTKVDGLEHHQSSDNRSPADYFTAPDAALSDPSLLGHEYVHSWNGKYRRPSGLATANYSEPMKGDLLWVYEGLTNYLGEILSARAGMWNAEQYRDAIAITAAEMDNTPGRTWRPLRDTADQAQVLYHIAPTWGNYRRTTDFYREGSLIWLDVDTQLRSLSNGKKSIDDFVKLFHGADSKFPASSTTVKPYQLEDVVRALDAVQPHDWRQFLTSRVESTNERAPLEGIKRGGWKLVYTETPTEVFNARSRSNHVNMYLYSLGVNVMRDNSGGATTGEIADVLWNSPAFEAGLTPGQKIVAVNGEAIDSDNLGVAIAQAKIDKKPIELLVSTQDYFTTIRVPYFGGHKYPRLEKIEGASDLLGEITKAK